MMLNIAQTLQQAVSNHQAGQLAQAEALYQRILATNPNHPDALHLLGLISYQAGDHSQAESLIRKAVLLSNAANIYCNLGVVLQGAGKMEEAIVAYKTSIDKGQNDASVFFNLANTYKAQKDYESAIPYYRRAISIDSEFAAAFYNIGNSFRELEQFDDAIDSYLKALTIGPNDVDTLTNLGLTLHAVERYDEAIQCYQRIVTINPGLADNLLNLGNSFLAKLQFRDAEECYQKAIIVEPTLGGGYNNLGKIYQRTGFQDKAIEAFRQALSLEPDLLLASSHLILTLDMHPEMTVSLLQRERRLWANNHANSLFEKIPFANSRKTDRKLRVGYVSANFYQHSACAVFGAMIMHFNRDQFEVIAYSSSKKSDSYTQLLRESTSAWRNISSLSDDALSEQIRIDKIDILVDLSGHSDGNRLLVFARKPAPIQITAWGYIGGTGMKAMDYFLADPIVVAPDEKHLYAEEVMYLPCAINYFAFSAFPAVNELPALTGRGITFGSFNRLAKTTQETFETWIKILVATPDSFMLLKAPELSDVATRQRVLDVFVQSGITPERIMLLGESPWFDHMLAFNQVDISLDPYPHGGGVTTLEGIMMGVPVVTLRWPTIPGRISAAVLTPLGLTDWIAETPEQYVEIAVNKASDLMALAILRKQLRTTMSNSLVGNPKAYAREVENIYRQLWQRWCAYPANTCGT